MTDYLHRDSPLQNLLTNSRFGLWSNSTLAQGTTGRQADFEVGSAIRDDDPDDGDNSGDYALIACTITRTNDAGNGAGGDDFYYTITRDNPGVAAQNITVALSGLTVGKLYKFSAYIKDGTDAYSTICYMNIINNAETSELESTFFAAAAAWADYSIIWEATETNNKIRFRFDIDAADETMLIDDIYVVEVIPGCVAADVKGPDGWTKHSGVDCWRQHNDGTYTKDGSFYSLKITGSSTDTDLYWPLTPLHFDPIRLGQFAGRTVTGGLWIWASNAASARLSLIDTEGQSNTSYHTGGSGWEWLEITRTIDSDTAFFQFGIQIGDGHTAYISQPMLVFGSSIGEGNYSSPPGEIIWFESISRIFANANVASTDSKTLNLEALSNGKIPKGIVSVNISVFINNSAVATAQGIAFRTVLSSNDSVIIRPVVVNMSTPGGGTVPCDSNGDIYQGVTEADETLSGYYLDIVGVEVR